MSDGKTIVFGNDNASTMMSAIAPLLQRNSIDPGVLALMNNNGGFGGNNGWWWIIFLAMFWGGNGFGGFGGNRNGTEFLSNQMNNDAGRELLSEIIRGNGSKIESLAGILNTDVASIQSTLSSMQNALCQLGGTISLTSEQTRHAITEGNMQLMAQYAQCCCDIKGAIKDTNIALERGFSSLGFETAQQTCAITKELAATKDAILAGQRAAEMRELQRDITERDRKITEQAQIINNGQQTAIFSQMLGQAVAPLTAALGGLQKDVDGIKCKMPETATIPYSPVVGVPTCVAAQFGLNSFYGGVSPWG